MAEVSVGVRIESCLSTPELMSRLGKQLGRCIFRRQERKGMEGENRELNDSVEKGHQGQLLPGVRPTHRFGRPLNAPHGFVWKPNSGSGQVAYSLTSILLFSRKVIMRCDASHTAYVLWRHKGMNLYE